MFKNILLPLDGSVLAESVLPHAVAMAKLTGAQVTLFHVMESNQEQHESITPMDPMEWYLRKAAVQAVLALTSEKLEKLDIPVKSMIVSGKAAERIVEHADKLDADLIMLSRHGKSGAAEWSMGSVARKVIEGAGKSVMLVHATRQPAQQTVYTSLDVQAYRKIMVPLDGSRRAEYVLPIANLLAEQYHAQVLVAHVVVRPEIFSWSPVAQEDRKLVEMLVGHNQCKAKQYLDQLQVRLHPQAQTALLVGDDVAGQLREVADQEQIDLALLNAHGVSSNSKRPYGAVATNFIAYCPAPLLIFQDFPLRKQSETKMEHFIKDFKDYNYLAHSYA